MKKEKLYKVDKNAQEMIDAFKSAVENEYAKSGCPAKLLFNEVHKKEGYRMEAVLDYGDYKAKIYYDPFYFLQDFLDIELDLGGSYPFSIYDIFNLFDIQDFTQYYYSDIQVKDYFEKYVKNLFDMLNKYFYDIKKATDPQYLAMLDANVEADYKSTFPKDTKETWREDKDDPFRLNMLHPFYQTASDATDSDKLYKKLQKKNAKGKIDTLYEKRLFSYLEQGNTVVNDNKAEVKKQGKRYLKIKLLMDVCIFAFMFVLALAFLLINKHVNFSGAYMPQKVTHIFDIALPIDPADIIGLLVAAIPAGLGVIALFSKAILKKVTHNDPEIMISHDKFEMENRNTSAFAKVMKSIFSIVLIAIGIFFGIGVNTNEIGFYEKSVKFNTGFFISTVEFPYDDIEIAQILGSYEDDEYAAYTDTKSYVFYNKESGEQYCLEYLLPSGETVDRVLEIAHDYNKEIKEFKSMEDFQNKVFPDEELF